MATRRSRFITNLWNSGFMRVLQLTAALAVAPCMAVSGGQTVAPSATSLPPNTAALPTSIKNAPFSADVVTEYDRELPNGNHIHRETKGKVFRDAQGRVRTETQTASFAGGTDNLQHIVIHDPILRVVIHLDPRTRTANVHHLSDKRPAVAANNGAAAAKTGDVLLVTPQTGAGSGTATAIPLQHSSLFKPPTIEPLGNQVIQGIPVVGTRTTRIFANADGEPIVAVTDVWYSHQLQMVILSTWDDGQSGRSVMRVTNLVRSAPNPQLFQVPPDYTVKNGNPIAAVIKH